jgi:transposase
MSTTPAPANAVPIGVGIDTARYGHHVTFLRDDLQPAVPAFSFAESRDGYEQLERQFRKLHQQFPAVHFHIRLDAAGQYAANLETFLRRLPFPATLSIGEPARNQRYRQALFPKRKSDPVESYCAARYALRERPGATPAHAAAIAQLRETVSRLEAQSRHSTRLINQLHNLLARVFPELAMIQEDLTANWVLRLLDKYPTPQLLARARLATLESIPFLPAKKATRLQELARATIGSLTGATAERLVRGLLAQLRRSRAAEDELKQWMVGLYRGLPTVPPLTSIPGIGDATAAVLVAKVVAIDRFTSAAALVGYFGLFAEDYASGVDKQGEAKPGRTMHMSRKGNDLVRKYLWNAAKTATLHNPAVRALYHRLVARGRRGDVALGHGMRKLVHLVFAVWKSGKPFDPAHYPWEPVTPASSLAENAPEHQDQTDVQADAMGHSSRQRPDRTQGMATPINVAPAGNAAEFDLRTEPRKPRASQTHAPATSQPAGGAVDFAFLRTQVTMEQILAHLGHLHELSGSGPQRRGRCPVHSTVGSGGRTFSVHLGKNIFQCFHPPCGIRGNVLDLWAAVHHLRLREAALHLAATFNVPVHPSRDREEEPVQGTRRPSQPNRSK